MRNSSMGPPLRIDPMTHCTTSERSYHGATSHSTVSEPGSTFKKHFASFLGMVAKSCICVIYIYIYIYICFIIIIIILNFFILK